MVYSLHFTLSLSFIPGLQSGVCSLFYTDRFRCDQPANHAIGVQAQVTEHQVLHDVLDVLVKCYCEVEKRLFCLNQFNLLSRPTLPTMFLINGTNLFPTLSPFRGVRLRKSQFSGFGQSEGLSSCFSNLFSNSAQNWVRTLLTSVSFSSVDQIRYAGSKRLWWVKIANLLNMSIFLDYSGFWKTHGRLGRRPHVSGYFWIRNFFFPDTASVHASNILLNPLSRVEKINSQQIW